MLCDVEGTRGVRLYQGVYQSRWWNFELEFRGRQDFEKDYPSFADSLFDSIGVCDSPEQLIERLPKEVTEGPKQYVISMVRIDKAEQESYGGWRWHKWGEYIGNQNPQYEYLYDEPEIETVWTYHVYVL